MIKRYVVCIIIAAIIISDSHQAYSGEAITGDGQVTKIDLTVTDNPASKDKPWAEMSAGERTGFVLAMPIVIPAIIIVGAWDLAVGTIKIHDSGSADIINKYR